LTDYTQEVAATDQEQSSYLAGYAGPRLTLFAGPKLHTCHGALTPSFSSLLSPFCSISLPLLFPLPALKYSWESRGAL